MKIYGFENDASAATLLVQATLDASPDELRLIAEFLIKCAADMSEDEGWEHEHLCDYLGEEIVCDLVVYNSKIS